MVLQPVPTVGLNAPSQLRNLKLFAGLSETELNGISACLVRRAFAKGTYLYHPGNPGLNMWLIESGLVRLFFANARGEEYVLNLHGPHGIVGLPLLPDERVRMAGAAAHRDTVAWAMPREEVFRLIKRSPRFALDLYLEVAESMRLLGVYAQAHTILNLDGRLANLFLYLTREHKGDKVDELELPLSQAEVASWVGGSRGRINRAMSKMQELDLIRVSGQKLFVLNRAGLAKMAEDLIVPWV